jgi:hypothetical protein
MEAGQSGFIKPLAQALPMALPFMSLFPIHDPLYSVSTETLQSNIADQKCTLVWMV